MPRQKDAKEKIADRFQAHFTHFGFRKTSVDDVAKELKISKKTIYEFFDSKEKVFYFVVSRIARAIRSRMEKQLQRLPSPAGKLGRLIEMIFSESRKWLRRNDAFEFKYKYEIAELAFRDAFGDLLRQLVAEGMERGEFAKAPVDLRVGFIQGMIAEAMKLLSANPELAVEAEVVRSVLKLLR